MYVVPQVLVFQEFETIPSAITDPLRAHISGPNAQLHRYSDPDEKALIDVGSYDPETDTLYEFPERTAGGKVDASSVRVFIEDARMLYFENLVSDPGTITKVANKTNQVVASTDIFATADGFTRNANLNERDVQPGDIVWLRGVNPDDSDTYEQWTYVRSLAKSLLDSTVGAAYSDIDNQESSTFSASVEAIGDDHNCVELTVDASAYDGRKDGGVSDTYTITVTKSSADGDHSTAEIRVVSATGNDNDLVVVPSEAGVDTPVGSRGLILNFDVLGAGSSCSLDSPETSGDLIAGQEWQVTITQEFEASRAFSGGAYTGDTDTTYLIEVTRGGAFAAVDVADRPQITISTADGTDIGGPITLSAFNTLYPIGSKGVEVGFLGTSGSSISSVGSLSVGTLPDALDGLRKGDRFYIDVLAAANGKSNILVLGHAIRSELRSATNLDLRLYIEKDIEIPSQRVSAPGTYNWELEGDTEIQINSGIEAYDSTWIDDDGEQLPMPVMFGEVFVEYREWLSSLCELVNAISDTGSLDAIPGPLDVDNPLKWGVFKALGNSNGTPVKYTAVCDPDSVDSWQDVVATLVGRDDVYNLVPLTKNKTVLDLFAAHIANQSTPEVGRWRAGFFNLSAEEESLVVGEDTHDEVILATITDDPTTDTTVYRWLEVPAGNADFIEHGVAAGDIVRAIYTADGFGGETYTEFVVDEVIAEDTLRLRTGHTVAINVAAKIEVWHPNSKTEIADKIGTSAAAWGTRRICAVWPDTVSSGGVEMEGYHLCAALAGLRSGVVPHQPLTNVEIAGFDDISRTKDFFNGDQLNAMAEKGVWIVTQTEAGAVVTRHALTTDTSGDTALREEMIRANIDSISYFFLRRLEPFIGNTNVTDGTIRRIRAELQAGIEFLINAGFTERLGGQLRDGTRIREVREHTILRDRVVAVIDLVVPFPLNNIELYLVV